MTGSRNIIGAAIILIGVVVVIGGFSMDTTQTSTTCYDVDSSVGAADSRGCVETTYNNPMQKMGPIGLGFGLIALGIYLGASSSNTRTVDDSSALPSSTQSSQPSQEANKDRGTSQHEQAQQAKGQRDSSKLLSEQLRERQDESDKTE